MMRTLSQTKALDIRTDVCCCLVRNQRTHALACSRERISIPAKLDSCVRWQRSRTCHHAPVHAVGSVQCGAAASADAPLARKPRRVMLKVSGEALEGDAGFGVDPKVLRSVAAEVASAAKQGIEVAIVVGGGNFFRGVDAWDGLDRATADHMGMLATCMNAICLQSALDAEGMDTRVQTSIDMRQVAEPYIRRRAIRHLERGRIVIFGAGTGNPFFTTDTAAALRAAEIDADVFLKATKVDGVYDCDPLKNPNAKLHRALTYKEVTMGELAVMDETAITLCKENDIPVVVFNLMISGNISRALLGDTSVGTTVNSTRSEPEAELAPATEPEQGLADQPSAASSREDNQLHLSRHH